MIRSKRRGQSMLELVAATTIITIALVPALRLTRNAIASSEALESAEMCTALCTSKLEEELARTAGRWDLTTRVGDFDEIGRSELRFMVVKSDAVADGGIPNSLTTIDVVVWRDDDGGHDLDPNEFQTRLTTKLARLISYEHQATLQ